MASGIKSYVASGGGGMVKRMHAGWAASSGVRAALLARDGFTGPAGAIDGRYGLLDVFGGKAANPERLTPGLGETWAINEVWFNDPALRALAARVTTRVDEACEAVYPQRFGSRVQLHLANGAVKEALTLDPHGTPADPCTDAELAAKFTRLAALSPLGVDSAAVARAVARLPQSTSLRDLSHALRAA